MKPIIYLQEGITANKPPNHYNKFYIVDRGENAHASSRYYYPGDNILNDLDNLCVSVYDVFQSLFFESSEEYYKNIDIRPMWITQAGVDSDFSMSKSQLKECFESPIPSRMKEIGINDSQLLEIYGQIDLNKYKYAYVADCQGLIGTLQELILSCHSSLIGFYTHLGAFPSNESIDEISYIMGPDTQMVFTFLSGFFIQIHSCFDILTKIVYEFENLRSCDDNNIRLASKGILYGNRKDLEINNTKGTIFEKTYTTMLVENMRNELVHNAAWEMNPKVFVHKKCGRVVERYILMPDFTDNGTLVTYKNRRRFFSEGKKANDEIPKIYFDILQRIYFTLVIAAKNTGKFNLLSL